MAAINKVLYDDIGFHGNRNDYYDDLNSFIDQVLDFISIGHIFRLLLPSLLLIILWCSLFLKVLNRKTGIPISLCVIYLAIARRLHVKLDPVINPFKILS